MTNPYAPPKDLSDNVLVSGFQNGDSGDLHIEGDSIVCTDHTVFPDRCVVCNADTQSPKLKRKMFWHPSWVYVLVIISWPIYLIVALIVRQTGTVHYALCKTHRQRRIKGLLLAWLGLPGSFIAIIATAVRMDQNESVYGALLVLSLLGMIAFPIIGLVMAKTVVPKRIHKGVLWLTAGKPFTSSL